MRKKKKHKVNITVINVAQTNLLLQRIISELSCLYGCCVSCSLYTITVLLLHTFLHRALPHLITIGVWAPHTKHITENSCHSLYLSGLSKTTVNINAKSSIVVTKNGHWC